MRRVQRIGLVIGLIGLAVPAEAFEGVVHFKHTGPGQGQPMEFEYFISGDKVRVEMPAQRGQMGAWIMDTAAKRIIVLMPPQKLAMVMPIVQPQERDKPQLKEDHFIRTGKTQTIAGYPTEQITYKSETGETEMWGAKGLGWFMGTDPATGPGGLPPWARQLQREGFFPLLIVTKDLAGAEKGRMEATKIDKKALSAELFRAPADYKTMDRESMMHGLGGSPGMPGGKVR